MAAMFLCLKSKFFKVAEMFQIPFGSIQDLVSCKNAFSCPNSHNIMHKNCNPKTQTVQGWIQGGPGGLAPPDHQKSGPSTKILQN